MTAPLGAQAGDGLYPEIPDCCTLGPVMYWAMSAAAPGSKATGPQWDSEQSCPVTGLGGKLGWVAPGMSGRGEEKTKKSVAVGYSSGF